MIFAQFAQPLQEIKKKHYFFILIAQPVWKTSKESIDNKNDRAALLHLKF